MKKYSLILLFFCLTSFWLQAQDSTNHPKKILDNRYGPFHQTIKDTTKRTISEFGHYFSAGVGAANVYNGAGFAGIAGYSLAYKSHVLSITAAHSEVGLRNTTEAGYKANYIGGLLGESIRLKHFMFSISAGVGYNDIIIINTSLYSYNVQNPVVYSNYHSVSFPVELKAFFLTRGGLGIGLHISENIVTKPRYSPFYIGVCIVLGKWNKKSSKVDNAFYKESVR